MLTFGQSVNQDKRTIRGLVCDNVSNSTAIGSTVLQYKTMNGTVIQSDGMFELEVPKGDTVLIHIPFCFDSFYVMYLPTDNYKKIILSKKLKKQSKKTLDFWEKRKKA
jgi:hypothetical protein